MRQFSILSVVLFTLFFPCWAENGKLLWSRKTDWGEIRVREEGKARILLFADGDGETEESRILVDKPYRPQARYLRQMLAAAQVIFANKSSPRYLVVGMGAGTLSMALAPDARLGYELEASVTSVEIEPAVVEAAKRYFFYKESEQFLTVVDDARHFLETTNERYDAIFLDAFDGVEVPEPLRTVEFAQLLDRHLASGGMIIANVHFVPEEPSLRYQKSLLSVFEQSYMINGLAQGVGIYSHTAIPLPTNDGHRFLTQIIELGVEPAPEHDLTGVEPYRDR